jgi:general stress protein YciG
MTDTSNKGLGSDKMDPQTKHDIQSEGGQSSHSEGNSSSNGGNTGMKGGQASEQSNNNHELTSEEQSKGGSNSSGNFANDPQKASQAGKIGGSN